uniref:RING-type E3 ubiquitin transferase n=1 Tax=Canid alphaherpesvirus 1 TaxID=170325 RepID=A0A172DSI3_9ALPH|nr:ubiquitin E3 ligase ICP0 [Canid alphaherpesvirus 1]
MADEEYNCTICLEPPKNMTVTMSCLHKFCYDCLSEWTKVSNTCPLCKSIIQSMIHSINDDKEFKEIKIVSESIEDSTDLLMEENAQRFFNSDEEDANDDDDRPLWGEDYDENYSIYQSEPASSQIQPPSHNSMEQILFRNPNTRELLIRFSYNRLMVYYEHEGNAEDVTEIIMEFIDEYGLDRDELTELLEPLLQTYTIRFVNSFFTRINLLSRRPFRISTGVQFLDDDDDDDDENSVDSESDSSSSLCTDDLTIPDDTQSDISDLDETNISTGQSVRENYRTRLRSYTENSTRYSRVLGNIMSPTGGSYEPEISEEPENVEIIDLTIDSDDDIG